MKITILLPKQACITKHSVACLKNSSHSNLCLMRDAPRLKFDPDQNACALLTPDKEQMLEIHKVCIGKDDSCLNANLVEKLDGLPKQTLLIHTRHCTVRLAHTIQQVVAHTKTSGFLATLAFLLSARALSLSE